MAHFLTGGMSRSCFENDCGERKQLFRCLFLMGSKQYQQAFNALNGLLRLVWDCVLKCHCARACRHF